jgi:hypothetical protein
LEDNGSCYILGGNIKLNGYSPIGSADVSKPIVTNGAVKYAVGDAVRPIGSGDLFFFCPRSYLRMQTSLGEVENNKKVAMGEFGRDAVFAQPPGWQRLGALRE